MGDIDTNLFGEKPVELDTEEIEKAKKEIASKGSVLLTVAPQMPSPEDIGRSRALANRAMREAESLVVKDLESYKTGCDLSLACAQAIKAVCTLSRTFCAWVSSICCGVSSQANRRSRTVGTRRNPTLCPGERCSGPSYP